MTLALTNEVLEDFLFKCDFRVKSTDFSRESKMGFKETVLFIMSMVKKSLQLELDSFFEKILNKDFSVTKQAYLEARKKIKPELFIQLNDKINEVIYQEADDGYETWNGYRLSAIDGSILEIPDTEELRNEFGFIKNQNKEVARAKASCIYDVVNKIVIKSVIDRYDTPEREMAKQMILKMLPNKKRKELILFDRGYPAAELMAFLIDNGIDFVMRAQRNFSNAVINAKKEDQVINVYHNNKAYKVRVLRFILDSEQEEILLTSLLDEKLMIKEFKILYFKRWGIEVKFDELKNKLELENFTGTNRSTIEQDFYVSMYLSNMIELARAKNDETIKEKAKNKHLKYEYKTNLNILIGTMKDKFILMILEESPTKRKKMMAAIMKQISKSTIPIRPERHNPRKEKIFRGKFKTNCKRNM